MNELLKSIGTWAGIALGGYTFALFTAQAIQDLFSQKINSQSELDEILIQESEKIGLDKRFVVGKFYNKEHKRYKEILGARCFIDNYNFEGSIIPLNVVELKEGWGARRGTVRHELYHLQKHLNGKKRNFFKSFFYEEPTATLYALTGLKL